MAGREIAGKNATIYDIARLSDTSTATVSRVLNNTGYPVKEDLRKRILRAAEELNYIPNLVGKQLTTNKNRDIGVIIPNIANQFYPHLVLGVEDAARAKGYNILLCNSHRDKDNEEKYLMSLFQKQIKGIILSSIMKNHDLLKGLMAKGLKVVTFEQDIDLECSKISFNYHLGGYIAAKHLIELGHKKIGFIGAPLTIHSRKKIYAGFVKCLKDNNIPVVKDFVKLAGTEKETNGQIFEYKNGMNLMKQIIMKGNLPTAIFCTNDMTAFGAMRECAGNKIRVPEDISIMGFDNISFSEMISPRLTTIDQCTYEMGSLAAEQLISSLENNLGKHVSINLEPVLLARESTRRP